MEPWILLGDYNTVWQQSEHVNDEGTMGVDTSELQNLFSGLALFDLHFTGHFHTWCNQRMGPARIYCKLDRAIVNARRLSSFPLSCALFLNKGVSDHSPCLVKITNDPWEGPRPFLFCDMWKTDPSYMQLVSSAWRDTIQGHPMYILVNRLKKTKNALRDLHRRKYSNLQSRVDDAEKRLQELQQSLLLDPFNIIWNCKLQNNTQMRRYQSLLAADLSLATQRAKVDWLTSMDSNTTYFHARVKEKAHKSRILAIQDANGN